MKIRGIKIRLITEIRSDNIQHCKELMNIAEVRHLDEVKGNFGIADGVIYTAGVKSVPDFFLQNLAPFSKRRKI